MATSPYSPLFYQISTLNIYLQNMSERLILKGIPASQGIAQGKVKIIKGSQDSKKFNRGDILVTKITDPTMVSMIAQAGAIICDLGGITSHPAIVSRELGIPCVVNTKEATRVLKDGMKVEVQGTTGEIYQPNNKGRKNNIDNEIDIFLDSVVKSWGGMDFRTFADNVIWTAYDPLIAKAWTRRVLRMIADCRRAGLQPRELARLFSTTSQLRCTKGFDLWMANYADVSQTDRKKIFAYYSSLLRSHCLEDPYCQSKNIIHSRPEIENLLGQMKVATPAIAKSLGKVANACYHVGHALYSDMYPQTVSDNYGPYQMGKKYDNSYTLVVKVFNNLRCLELWPETTKIPCDRIQIVCLYKNVEMKVDAASHVIFQGDLINNLEFYGLKVDGKEYPAGDLGKIVDEIEKIASSVFQQFQKLSFEEKKEKYYHLKAYGYRGIYEELGQDWRPAAEILREARGKKLYSLTWPKSMAKRKELIRETMDPRTDFRV